MQLLPLALLFATTLPPAPAQLPVRVLPFKLHRGSVWMPVRVNLLLVKRQGESLYVLLRKG